LIKEGDVSGSTAAKILGHAQKDIFSYAVLGKGLYHLWKNESLADETLAKKRVLAFCGIARPERFFSQLEGAGARIVSRLAFPDHHPYPDSSLDKIIRRLKASGAEAAVTTEKDALKILGSRGHFEGFPVYCLTIGLRIEPEFYARLDAFIEESLRLKSL
jgi:tetraacyldisaccharide 4'-kinase